MHTGKVSDKYLYDLIVQLSLLLAWVILQLCLFLVIWILICWRDFPACPQYGLAWQSLDSWLALVIIPGPHLAQVLQKCSPCWCACPACACPAVTLSSWLPCPCRAAQGSKALTGFVSVQLPLGSHFHEEHTDSFNEHRRWRPYLEIFQD